MKGILIKPVTNNYTIDNKSDTTLNGKLFLNKNLDISRVLNKKFENDKLFYEDENFVIATDGIILNATSLKKQNAVSSNSQLIKKLYKSYDTGFFKLLRGELSLVLFDKKNNRLLVFTNIIGTKPFYFYTNNNSKEFYLSSNPLVLVESLKEANKKLTPDYDTFQVNAAFTYLLGDSFFVKEIRRLKPGHYLELLDDKVTIKSYYILKTFPLLNYSFEAAVDKLEELFKHAVCLQYEKDKEYGYKHLSTLSGGLDSRMATLVGVENGYKPDTLTFSAKGYWDQIIAKNITRKYKLDNICLELNSGDYLKKFNRSFNIDAGAVSNFMANQMFDLYNNVDLSSYGMIHTGQAGDAIIGSTICKTFPHAKYAPMYPYYNENYISFIEPKVIREMENYDTHEITNFYNHIFNGTSKGNQIIYEFTESASPFTFQDVIQFCLSLPLAYRRNHKLYLRWVEKYHKKAGSFFYEGTKRRTLPYNKNKYLNKSNTAINLLLFQIKGLKSKNNQLLNFEKWKNNSDLSTYFKNSFDNHIQYLPDTEMKKNLLIQYQKGNFKHKLAAHSAVMSYIKIFNNSN